MGAKRVVFHPSSQGKLSREEAVNLTHKRLEILADKIVENGYDDMIICPETYYELYLKDKTADEIVKEITEKYNDITEEDVRLCLEDVKYLEENGKLRITVAGLGKKVALDYILSQDIDAFDFFSNNMYIPKGYAGKMIHTYIDMPSHGIVKDYLGNYGEFNELSSLYMEPADYSLSIGREYAKFLFSVKERVVWVIPNVRKNIIHWNLY